MWFSCNDLTLLKTMQAFETTAEIITLPLPSFSTNHPSALLTHYHPANQGVWNRKTFPPSPASSELDPATKGLSRIKPDTTRTNKGKKGGKIIKPKRSPNWRGRPKSGRKERQKDGDGGTVSAGDVTIKTRALWEVHRGGTNRRPLARLFWTDWLG